MGLLSFSMKLTTITIQIYKIIYNYSKTNAIFKFGKEKQFLEMDRQTN
jgi:hypothetical protein